MERTRRKISAGTTDSCCLNCPRMGRKTKIAIVAGCRRSVLLGAVGAYAYDSSQKDKIADGVTIGGVDVGGMTRSRGQAGGAPAAAGAAAALAHGSATTARAGSCRARASRSTPTSTRAVEEALDDSREGGLPGRLVRYVTGGERRQAGLRPASPTPSPPSTASSARSPTRSTAKPQDADGRAERRLARGRRRRSTAASCATTCSPASSTPRCSTPAPTTRSPPAPTRSSRR